MDVLAETGVGGTHLESALQSAVPALRGREAWRAYVELTKPRITMLIVLTAAAGFALASRNGIDYWGLLHSIIGIGLLSSGIAALNQWLERESDALMRRTEKRPLPSGRLTSRSALIFGLAVTAVSELYMVLLINPLTAALGLIAFGSYLFLYTPLKTRTTLCTAIGALPGAMPPLLGWTAASNAITVEAWVIFAILFLWQFPHFFAIAWMYREDYERAGIKMLPVVEPDGRVTGQQIVLYASMLLPVSLLPALIGMAGSIYFVGALLLGAAFLFVSARTAFVRSKWQARRLLQASILYLPVLFALMVFSH